ncbi:MAG: BON domain-containing protein, partial [Pyrinomonadaceae bacterium]
PPLTQSTPIIIEQPAPVVITQPPPVSATTTAPPSTSSAGTSSGVADDSAVQSTVSRKIQDDTELSPTDIIATAIGGRVTLTGTVKSPDLKRRAERLALTVKGVRSVDNQIAVLSSATPAATP